MEPQTYKKEKELPKYRRPFLNVPKSMERCRKVCYGVQKYAI